MELIHKNQFHILLLVIKEKQKKETMNAKANMLSLLYTFFCYFSF